MGLPSHNHPMMNFCLPPAWKTHLLQIFLVLVATSAVQAAGCDPPPSGIVAWWPAEGNANDIVGTNNGTLMGGATANAPGYVGTAFTFDGTNGYVKIPSSPTLEPSNLTIEAWVKFRSLNSVANRQGQQYIVFKESTVPPAAPDTGVAYGLGKDRLPSINSNGDCFYFNITSPSGPLVEVDSVRTVATNVWYHLAAVRGSNYIQLYIDGQLDVQTQANFPQDYNGHWPVYFGDSGQSWDGKLNGELDEVSIYNRALSSNEIMAIYQAGSAGKCKGLLATSTSLTSSTHSATYGSSVTFTSTVTGSGTTPTGTVAFMDGATILGAGLLNGSGVATFSTNKLSVAGSPHSINAVYGGDSNFAGSTSSPVSLTITAATVTPNITVSDKTYDGTTNGTISSRSLSGVISGDDVNLGTSGSASFSDKNVGTGKTVTVTGLALTGTTARNYQLASTTATTTANIFAQALTVTATGNTKLYDGTTTAAALPAITTGSLQSTDTASFMETYDTKDVGTGKTLTPSGTVNDGNSGNNYSYTFVSSTNGTITASFLEVTAVANTKTYDGTTNASAIPGITSGSLQNTDTADFIETYDTKDVGTNKMLTPGGVVNDDNDGNNYQVTYVSTNTGIINPVTLTVTADDKIRWFGAANPMLTAHFSGFVPGDSTNVLSGNPDLSTIATPGSPPDNYPITVSMGTLSATNYTFTFVNGTLTVLALPQLSTIGASGNQFTFSFPTVSNQSYQLEYNTNLALGSWIPLGGPIIGGGFPVIVTNDMNDPQGFFRLNLQP